VIVKSDAVEDTDWCFHFPSTADLCHQLENRFNKHIKINTYPTTVLVLLSERSSSDVPRGPSRR
jgi:hypothetical protein